MKKQLLTLASFLAFYTSTRAQLSFAPVANYGVNNQPRSVTSADFNNDSHPDLAVVNSNSNNVSILMGSATGTFAAAVNYGVGNLPYSVTSGDFNGDGNPDLAVTNINSNNVSVLLGSASGTFAVAVNYLADSNPFAVTSADFNGDGHSDLAVANRSSQNISVLTGIGNGTFNTAVNYTVGNGPSSLTSDDFNGDGYPDITVANYFSNSVSVLLGSATGTFASAVNYGVGNNPLSVTSGDFNGDGNPDLAVANINGNNVSVLFGSATGTYSAAFNYVLGFNPNSITSADFNDDGNPDLAVSNNTGVWFLVGFSNGTFSAPANYGGGSNNISITSADFNSDGRPDVAAANLVSNNVAVLLNNYIPPPAAALNFDGVDDRVNIGPSLNTILNSSNKITVEAWVNPSTNTGLGCIVGNYNTLGSDMQFLLRRDNNKFAFYVDKGTGLVSVTSVATSTVGVWQHVAGSWNGSVLSVYVNGVLSNTTALIGANIKSNLNPILIGANNISEKFTGSIDEVRIWNKTLCQPEIQNNMSGEIAATAPNLIANYHFNQGKASATNTTVTTLIDASASALTGTLTNMTLKGGTSNWIAPGAVISGSLVTAFVSPTVAIAGAITICNGATTTFTASGVSTYSWTSGPTTATFVVTPTVTTTYSVVGTATNGCVSNMVTKTLTVNATPTVAVNSGSICSGNTFTIVPSGASTYTVQGGSTIVTPTTTTVYTLTGTAANGCVSSNTAVSTVSVNSLPVIMVNSGSICSGNTFTIIPSGASTYTVQGGTTVVTPTTATVYTVTGTDANGCVSSNTATSSVNVNALPTVLATTNNTLICTGQTASLTASGATSYTWNTSATTNVIAISPTVTTTYTVNGTDANGCSNTTTITQNVSLCTGVTSLTNSEASINVYPNPNNGLFVIELTTASKVTVTNALGQVVMSQSFEAGKHDVNITSEATGVYFVQVMTNNNQQILKIIKE